MVRFVSSTTGAIGDGDGVTLIGGGGSESADAFDAERVAESATPDGRRFAATAGAGVVTSCGDDDDGAVDDAAALAGMVEVDGTIGFLLSVRAATDNGIADALRV